MHDDVIHSIQHTDSFSPYHMAAFFKNLKGQVMPFSGNDFISRSVVRGLKLTPHSIKSLLKGRIYLLEPLIKKKFGGCYHVYSSESFVADNRKIIGQMIFHFFNFIFYISGPFDMGDR